MVLPLQPRTARQPSAASHRKRLGLMLIACVTIFSGVIARLAYVTFSDDMPAAAVVESVETVKEGNEAVPVTSGAVVSVPDETVLAEEFDSEALEALAEKMRKQYFHLGEVEIKYVPVSQRTPVKKRRDGRPIYDGRPLRKVGTMRMLVTAYSPDERSCGKWADGITASGDSVYTNNMQLVAADTRLLPFGTLVSVPGYAGGAPVPVLDRGGKIKGHRLDVLYPTHERALKWGRRALTVTIWGYAE